MALPININDLLTGQTVEWERLEFKSDWNPLDTLQSICAFANDINNWGGGYIIIGVEEKNGRPTLPPRGLSHSRIDTIQKELINYCHKLRPNYFPIIEPIVYNDAHIVVVWVPGGEVRPYRAPARFVNGKPTDYRMFIRRGSITKVASAAEERDLVATSASIPFDDRINQQARLSDIDKSLILNHLLEIGSGMAHSLPELPFDEVCRRLNIAAGPDEFLRPKNAGILLFSQDPSRFFPCARIEIVHYLDSGGDTFLEKHFRGPIQKQLQDALDYLRNNIITEVVEKVPGEAKARRFFNYPFSAVEEALANTVYHRSYQDDSPIEVRIWPDKMEILSYPGPLPPITKEKLAKGHVVARKYRNRLIGDFLKELRLTEGKGTGIPAIFRSMSANGSPSPILETDDELQYFLVTLPARTPQGVQVGVQVNRGEAVYVNSEGVQVNRGEAVYVNSEGVQVSQRDIVVLSYCRRPKKRREIFIKLGLFASQKSWLRAVGHLLEGGYLAPTIPDKLRSRNQQYRTTSKGEELLKKL